jgi:hypothetical protein
MREKMQGSSPHHQPDVLVPHVAVADDPHALVAQARLRLFLREPVNMVALTPGGCQIGGHVRPELDLWVALTPGGCQIGYVDRTGCHQLCFDCKIT